MCHSGLPPPPEAVYKEHGEDLERSVLNQVERSPLVPQYQPWSNTSTGRSPHWKGSMTQGHCPMNHYNRSLLLATIRLRHLLRLCFMCMTYQAPLVFQEVFLGFLAAHVSTACSKLLLKALIISRSLCK